MLFGLKIHIVLVDLDDIPFQVRRNAHKPTELFSY